MMYHHKKKEGRGGRESGMHISRMHALHIIINEEEDMHGM
jgi:hypothetical protein